MERPLTFTEARVRGIPTPEAKRVYYSDAKTKGLKLAVYPTGAKTFILYRKVQGKPERIFIGKWPEMAVEAAIDKADEMNGAIAKGENPAELRRQVRLEGTFKSLWDRYLEHHAKPNKRPRSVAEDEGIHKRYLAPWDTRRLSTITRRDVQRLHAEMRDENGIYAANRTLALLSTMFNKAVEWGWHGLNPCKGVRKFSEESRERFLTQDEMPRFLKALAEEPSRDFRDFILLALLTGGRRGNVMAMRFDEVDFAGATWTIPTGKAKGKKQIVIPLVQPAMKVLESRRERIASEWIFPSSDAECGHVTEFRKPWGELLARAKITNLRLHDVRRTLGSWMSKAGAALPIIKAALGHADIATTAIYTRGENPDVRRALEVTAKRMLGDGDKKESESDRQEGTTPTAHDSTGDALAVR
jgi:integrase